MISAASNAIVLSKDMLCDYNFCVKSTLKPIFLLAAGGMLLSLVSLVVWISVNRNIDGLIFGHVVSVEPASISIENREHKLTMIFIGTGTTITDRRQAVSLQDIPVGKFVQVIGTRIGKDTIRADAVRFMRSPRPEPPNEAPQ